MGYIETTWVTEAPSARQMGWGNIVFLASGDKPSQSSNPQLITPSNYTDYLSSTSYEYIAYESFKKNAGGTPTINTYVYWLGQGSGITGIGSQVTDLNYKIDFGPFSSIDTVQIDPTGGSNWQDIGLAPAAWASGVSGYRPGSGFANIYDGNIWFTGISGGGPYFESGGGNYSGTDARAIVDASGGILRVLATQNGFGLAQQELKEYDLQFVVPLYNVAGNGTGLENTPAHNDARKALSMVAGNRRMVIWALPKDGAPNTEYHGTSYDYNNFRSYLGQDQNAIIIYADVLTGSNGTGLDDPAGALAGRICVTHPHRTLTLKPLTISLENHENENNQVAWKAGQIICPFKNTDWGFDTTQINYGFTFAGTTPSNRLNNVRCKYITLYNIYQDLWRLLSSDKGVPINKSGLNKTIEVIHGTLDRLLSQGIIDANNNSAQRFVDIPLLRGSQTEWSNANASRRIPAIIIRWPWVNTAETLKITEFGEIV